MGAKNNKSANFICLGLIAWAALAASQPPPKSSAKVIFEGDVPDEVEVGNPVGKIAPSAHPYIYCWLTVRMFKNGSWTTAYPAGRVSQPMPVTKEGRRATGQAHWDLREGGYAIDFSYAYDAAEARVLASIGLLKHQIKIAQIKHAASTHDAEISHGYPVVFFDIRNPPFWNLLPAPQDDLESDRKLNEQVQALQKTGRLDGLLPAGFLIGCHLTVD